ncbi:hypothetical protein ACFOET_05150 [Parapedobacter deserti]|uniref:DinB-like domain-containing protein n=1 Tax=Parapedobacter deserti TaxID=1912957 RepID=A0ABV7JG22_9SPHI
MDRKSIIQRYWQLAIVSDGWYLLYMHLLSGIDAALARWQPEGVWENTIWETVTHITHSKEQFLRSDVVKGSTPDSLSLFANSKSLANAERFSLASQI